MIPIDRLLYKLDLRLNKKASTEHQSIPVEDKILALNEAQIKLVKKKLNNNNILGTGYDGNKKRYEDLQILLMPPENLSVTENKDIYTSYKADLTQLQEMYLIPADMAAFCTKKGCTNHPVAINKIIPHGDLNIYYNNTNYRPSFEYQDTFCQITNDNVYIYTDNTFTVESLYISYLRYPKPMDSEGYTNFNGIDSTNIDCELSEHLEDELLDIATLELAIDTENTPQVQLSQLREKHSE